MAQISDQGSEVATEDDASRGYMVHAQNMATEAAVESFMQRVRSRQAGEGAKAAPATEAAGTAAAKGPEQNRSILERFGGFFGDLGYGTFVESPTAVVGGVNDAVRNAATGLKGLGDWLQDHIGGEIPVPSTGSELADRIIQRPLDALVGALPDKVKEQQTTTGHVIREGARFITGFVPALRALRGAGVPTAPAVIAGGAASDFATMDPSAGGIANLIQTAPSLRNPLTEYLATDPDSPEALNRLRHAVEGAGFGIITEGIVRGIRFIAQARKAVPELEAQKQLYGTIDKPEALMVAGDDAALVTVGKEAAPSPDAKLAASTAATETGVPTQVAARGVVGSAEEHANQAGVARVLRADDAPASREELRGVKIKASDATDDTAGPDVYVNFSRMNTPDDVNQVIRDMADAFKGDVNAARRGVQSNEETAKLANQLGMTPEDLLTRRQGQPLNAEESLAARNLLATSADKLLETARKAAAADASAADQYNFRRMLAVHHAIQSEVIAARTETARALQAWSIPAGGNVEMARSVQALIDASGGSEVTTELARRFATLAHLGTPEAALANMARRGWAATSKEAVQEAYVLGLLWSPTTHVVNSVSNATVAFQQIYERAAGRAVGDFLGTSVDARIVDGEAVAMTYGLITSLKDALYLGARALRTGETGAGIGSKIDLPRDPAIGAAPVSRELGHSATEAQAFAETPIGRAIDFIGEVNRVPGRLLGAEDEFFKTISYRAEVHAQALRQATQEGRTGPDLWRRMAEIANDPPESIRISAADAALYATFQNKPGEWAQAVLNLRNSGSLNPTFMVLPFVKTPANILRYTFERSPLAPLVSQWRADISAGGARRDLALARMGTGTAIVSVAMDLASSGLITGSGPADPAKREALTRQGWQPNSIVVDGKYYSFNRLDPMGMLLGFAGTVSEQLKSRDLAPEDFDSAEEVVAHGIAAVSQSIVNKTFFTGVQRLLSTIQGSERGEGGVARYIDQQTGALFPFSSAFGFVEKVVDPKTREVNSPWQAIEAKIAGLSSRLPPARDLWGKERAPQEVYGRVFDAVSPAAVSARLDSPVDAEIQRLNVGVDRVKRKAVFQGVDVNFRDFPQVYDDYVRLAGNDLKHPAWQLGAKDFLDAVVSGSHPMSSVYQMYSDGKEGGKANFLRNVVSEYRKLAQQDVMREAEANYPEFKRYVEEKQGKKQELKMPAGVAPPASGSGGGLRLP